MAKTKRDARARRKAGIRQRIKGTSDRPRVTVFRSLRHLFVQAIDDENNRVLATASTLGKANQADVQGQRKLEQAKKVGAKLAEASKSKGITKVGFDRNGYKYHGRVRVLADAAREAGLVF